MKRLFTTVQNSLETRLREVFNPTHLQVINESHMHSRGSDTHFKLIVVSSAFQGLKLIQRHRAVNEALGEAWSSGVHSLTITAKTPEEWEENSEVKRSPGCRGGEKNIRS